MAKRIKEESAENGFKEFLANSGNVEGLEYIEGLESGGHSLTVKGGGYIGQVDLDCIYSYSVFSSDNNKAIYADILQSSSSIGSAAIVLAYCILDDSAHLLIKGDTESAVRGYVKVVNSVFEQRYNGGKQNVGNPFRPEFKCKRIMTKDGICGALAQIHGYSPVDFREYPFNSYAYLLSGNAMASLVLGIELKITSSNQFNDMLLNSVSHYNYNGARAPEKLNTVLKDLRKRYIEPYARIKEDVLCFVLGEACARSRTPYIVVAKKTRCYKNRHDLTITTLCDFMHRRNYDFETATTLLGLGSEDCNDLVIEVLAEANRLFDYSYDYIVKKFMRLNDDDYSLLVATFKHLHYAYGSDFATLCERFHIKRDILVIRALCNF